MDISTYEIYLPVQLAIALLSSNLIFSPKYQYQYQHRCQFFFLGE